MFCLLNHFQVKILNPLHGNTNKIHYEENLYFPKKNRIMPFFHIFANVWLKRRQIYSDVPLCSFCCNVFFVQVYKENIPSQG